MPERKARRPGARRAVASNTPSDEAELVEDIDLRAWRNRHKRSLEWVGRKIGADKKNLSDIETRNDAGAAKIRNRWAPAYAKALGITVERMRRGVDAPETLGELVDAAPPDLQKLIQQMIETYNHR